MNEQNSQQENIPSQNQQVTKSEQKKRHGCLTAYLILFLIYLCYGADLLYRYISSQSIPTWRIYYSAIIIILYVIWIIALFKWKVWGFWGLCATGVVGVLIDFFIGEGSLESFAPLIWIAILYGVLQIGGEKKGWNQLEGRGSKKQKKDEISEGISTNETQSITQAPNGMVKTTWERVKNTVINLEMVVSGASGTVGFILGSFLATMRLMSRASVPAYASGWDWAFWFFYLSWFSIDWHFIGSVEWCSHKKSTKAQG